MQYGREHGYVVFTHDLDFGALLALTRARGPSVLQVRTQSVSRNVIAALCDQCSDGSCEPVRVRRVGDHRRAERACSRSADPLTRPTRCR
jgi:hypothetical protein